MGLLDFLHLHPKDTAKGTTLNLNFVPIFQEAAAAISVLAAVGLPIPSGLTSIVQKTLPVVTAVAGVLASPPHNATEIVSDIATVAASLPKSTGNTSADNSVSNILTTIEKYAAWKSTLESGQVVVDAEFPYTLNGVAHKAYNATFLDTAEIAKTLGLV